MHHNLEEKVSAASIIQQWHMCIIGIGKELVPEGNKPKKSQNTYFAMDFYYKCDEAHHCLLTGKKSRVHKTHPNKVPSDIRTIYNDVRGALYLSWGHTKGLHYLEMIRNTSIFFK